MNPPRHSWEARVQRWANACLHGRIPHRFQVLRGLHGLTKATAGTVFAPCPWCIQARPGDPCRGCRGIDREVKR